MKKLLLSTLLVLGTVSVNAAEDKVISVNKENEAMNAAIAKARSTLDDFLATHANAPDGARDFKVKVEFPATDGVNESEHLWFMPFKQTEKGFVGTLANDPYFIPEMKNGESYEFTRDQITDWGYVQGDKQIGNYTVCVLINGMEAAEAEPYKAMGFQCDE